MKLCHSSITHDINSNNKKEYHIVILRNTDLSYYTGYVGVTKDHILYGVEYTDVVDGVDKSLDRIIEVYRGLTYSGELDDTISNGDNVWYFGFDTFHNITMSDTWWKGILKNLLGGSDPNTITTNDPFLKHVKEQQSMSFDCVLDECGVLMKQLQDIDHRGIVQFCNSKL